MGRIGWMGLVALLLTAGAARAAGLPAWDFNPGLAPWAANADLAHVKTAGGVVEFDAAGRDGFLHARGLDFPATPWQYVHLRLKADRGGEAQLFWSGSLTGKNGGLSEKKSQSFSVIGDGQWHDYCLLPGWQAERTIRQLRFDVTQGGHFALDVIEVRAWGGAQPLTGQTTFTSAAGIPSASQSATLALLAPGAPYWMAPPLRLGLDGRDWVVVKARAGAARQAAVLWSTEGSAELHRTPFILRGDGAPHCYNLELGADPAWRGKLAVLGLEWPAGESGQLTLDSLAVTSGPLGPPELDFSYLGFTDAINRPGRPARVLARVANHGPDSGPFSVTLALPAGVRSADGQLTRPVKGLEYGESADVAWPVVAERDGMVTVTASASLPGAGVTPAASAGLRFDPALELPKADYVPEPRPIRTSTEVCMYYFPGWSTAERWAPIQRMAPIRKPVLGWYDEANPECVDWQIKWARENGISCFLLDWYWNQGAQHLEHWLAAYKRARYRDQLKIAIMWANHNPPGSHSRADWRRVTQYWIDNVFGLPACFKVNGRPAVFLWVPDRAREDVGGSAEFKAALAESQALARQAGYPGISFIAVNDDETAGQTARLAEEGFIGATSYHEWGKAPELAPSRAEVRYEHVAATAPAAWARRQASQGALTYYPVADSGWDARPWHGDNTMVISGRTPALFEHLLRELKTFQQAHPKPFIVLGPANEWGEGSYLEPNLEFGFQMYETVRKVFGVGDPAGWPRNYGPADVGRGPYDLPAPPPFRPVWRFEQDAGGWAPLMQVTGFKVEGGALRLTTTGGDNAIQLAIPDGMKARDYPRLAITMQVSGGAAAGGGDMGQLFWLRGGRATSEAASVRFRLERDGRMHTCTLDLAANPLWRSVITGLRLDPTATRGAEVRIKEIRFLR